MKLDISEKVLDEGKSFVTAQPRTKLGDQLRTKFGPTQDQLRTKLGPTQDQLMPTTTSIYFLKKIRTDTTDQNAY